MYCTLHLLGSYTPFIEPKPLGMNGTKLETNSIALRRYARYIIECLPKFIQRSTVLNDELTFYVSPSVLLPVMQFLRDHSKCQFKSIVAISGCDFPNKDERFEVVYHLLSVQFACRVRVKTYAGEAGAVPSVTSLFRGADWYEREAWDMYGVMFTGHPDL